jgi:hypothetical protein
MRFRIGGLMLLILLIAAGFGSLRFATPNMVRYQFNLLVCLLFFSAFRSRFAADPFKRARWFGFASAGWPYLLLKASTWAPRLPEFYPERRLGEYYQSFYPACPEWFIDREAFLILQTQYRDCIVDLLSLDSTLLLAILGATIAGHLHGRQERQHRLRRGATQEGRVPKQATMP